MPFTRTFVEGTKRMLNKLRDEVEEWNRRNFPRWWGHELHPSLIANKVGEEAGEVLGEVTRLQEGRGSLDKLAEEVGDAVISLASLCAALGVDMEKAVWDRWSGDVSQRTYGP